MQIPAHIGIIMDGNGRWAKKRGLPRVMGHKKGTEATRAAVEKCGELGVEYLTLYVFSAENWHRPENETKFLMNLLIEMLRKEMNNLNKNNVQIHTIGDTQILPESARQELEEAIKKTASNTGLKLVLAISYGGRNEIIQAAKSFFNKLTPGDGSGINSLNEEEFRKHFYMPELPDPELIIRTGGEKRLSNFLLWQAAYSELYFSETLWPDFGKKELTQAISDYNTRERRFGRLNEE